MVAQRLCQIIRLGVLKIGIHCSCREFIESTIRGGKEREGTRSTQVAVQLRCSQCSNQGCEPAISCESVDNALMGRVWCGCYGWCLWYNGYGCYRWCGRYVGCWYNGYAVCRWYYRYFRCHRWNRGRRRCCCRLLRCTSGNQ